MLLVVICKQSFFAVLRMTYLKHNAVLDEEEKSRIVGLCKQYTSLFADANERLQEMMAQLSNSEGVKNR